jgi:hypothetical protein
MGMDIDMHMDDSRGERCILSCMEMCVVRSMHIPQLIVAETRDEMPHAWLQYREWRETRNHATPECKINDHTQLLQTYCTVGT